MVAGTRQSHIYGTAPGGHGQLWQHDVEFSRRIKVYEACSRGARAAMVLDGAQKPALAASVSTVYDELRRTRGALRHKHQPRAGRQLHPESSPLGDVRQTRVAAAAGVGELWLELG
jgi:hypothetical protein